MYERVILNHFYKIMKIIIIFFLIKDKIFKIYINFIMMCFLKHNNNLKKYYFTL